MRTTSRGMLVFTIAAAAACGGAGIVAPYVLAPDEDTGCPSADEALAHTKAALDSPAVAALKPHLERILVEEGGLRVLIQGLAATFADLDQTTWDNVLAGLHPERGLGSTTPYVVEVLRYVDGTSAHVSGEHREPVRAVRTMLSTCEAPATLSTTRRLLQLEVAVDSGGATILVPPGSGDRSWLRAVLDAGRRAAEEPSLNDVLEQIELEDDAAGQGTIRVGREAFQLMARLFVENLAAPDFDPAASRALLEDAILTQVTDPEGIARVNEFLDVALLVTDPAAEVFPQTQRLMGCVSEADENGAIAGMLYDWMSIEALPLEGFLADIGGAADSEVAGDLRVAMVDLMGAVEARPSVATDVVRVLGAFLEDDVAAALVDAMIALQGQGVVTELVALGEGIAGCPARAP